MQASVQGQEDALSRFIRAVYRNRTDITSLKTLTKVIEGNFEKNFKPEKDQIDHILKQQNSSIYRNQCKIFKKRGSIVPDEVPYFRQGGSLHGLEENELSDDDEDGAQEKESALANEDYFTGTLATFT